MRRIEARIDFGLKRRGLFVYPTVIQINVWTVGYCFINLRILAKRITSEYCGENDPLIPELPIKTRLWGFEYNQPLLNPIQYQMLV